MTERPTAAQELIRTLTLAGFARHAAGELAERVGPRRHARRTRRDAALLLGRGTEAGAAIVILTLLAECKYVGLISPRGPAASSLAVRPSSSGT